MTSTAYSLFQCFVHAETSLKSTEDELKRAKAELLALKSRESTILQTELSANRDHIANLEKERMELKVCF